MFKNNFHFFCLFVLCLIDGSPLLAQTVDLNGTWLFDKAITAFPKGGYTLVTEFTADDKHEVAMISRRYLKVGQADQYKFYEPVPFNKAIEQQTGDRKVSSISKKGFYFPPKGERLNLQNIKQPEEVGLNPAIINALKSMGGTRWALWRHGYLVHVEGDFNAKSQMHSLRKTWHAMTVGAAIQQGKIPSYNQKLSVYQTSLKGYDADATWKHVMMQAAGFDYPGCGDSTDYKPGEMWTYSDLNAWNLCNALAKVYGKKDFKDNYTDVIKEAYFDAIGMSGYLVNFVKEQDDGPRFEFDLEDMGRLGLLALARGKWEGKQIIPQWFVEELEVKQTAGMKVNYNGCNDGKIPFDPKEFPEAPYGFMTWNNTDGK